jgi:hypothetical protein
MFSSTEKKSKGIDFPDLVSAFRAWTCTGHFGPGLGRGFLLLDLDAVFWASSWTRLFGPGLGRDFLGLVLEAPFWAWRFPLFASMKNVLGIICCKICLFPQPLPSK